MIFSARFAAGLFAILATVQLRAQAADQAARSDGIRRIESRHLVLLTDLPPSAEVDRLPRIFDQAVPQWAAYFGIDEAKTKDWQAQAHLIGERRRFDAVGLMPAGNDQFVNGISIGPKIWLHEQPSAYYRRHLLLHEGTHAFMASFLGGCGPGWYMEGTAELFATHHLDEQTGQLTLGVMPRKRADFPMLGRIKLIRDAFSADRAVSFPMVLRTDNRQQLENESYAWAWAAAKWLDSHPRYRDRFRQLAEHVLQEDFNEIVRRQYDDDWSALLIEWQAFVATLDYGYDFDQMAIEFQPGTPLSGVDRRMTIAADRGWQSTGVLLEAAKTYRITASGRYQIAVEKQDGVVRPWPCEPGGITIEYHEGWPLGMLLGAVVGQGPDEKRETSRQAGNQEGEAQLAPSTADSPGFARPIPIGLGCQLKPDAEGTLYLRVNDAAGRLTDNRGTLTATIIEMTEPANGNR